MVTLGAFTLSAIGKFHKSHSRSLNPIFPQICGPFHTKAFSLQTPYTLMFLPHTETIKTGDESGDFRKGSKVENFDSTLPFGDALFSVWMGESAVDIFDCFNVGNSRKRVKRQLF